MDDNVACCSCCKILRNSTSHAITLQKIARHLFRDLLLLRLLFDVAGGEVAAVAAADVLLLLLQLQLDNNLHILVGFP